MFIRKECESRLNYLISNFKEVNSHNKIYINNRDAIYLNDTICTVVHPDSLDGNKAFFQCNLELMKEIVLLKKEFNINHIYFEFFDEGNFLINYPKEKEVLNLEYLNEIGNDSFIVSFIKKNSFDELKFLESMKKLLSLYDMKKSFFILQYIFACNVVKSTTANKLLNVYTQLILDVNENYFRINNLTYINASVVNLFSLEFIKN